MTTRSLSAFLLALLASCSTLVPAPDLAPSALEVDPQFAWERHLAEFVDEAGRIDFDGMAEDPSRLERFVAWVAQPRDGAFEAGHDPSLGTAHEIAYLINAYNALAMYGVLHAGVLPKSKIRFFYLRDFEENGRRISLYDFENDVIRRRREPRIHFALNCMVRSCPRLPRVPFQADQLDAQLDAAAREFFNDPKHVELDPAASTVRFSAILDWYERDFIDVAPSLISYANRYRREPIPEDWKVRFLPYDWTLNQR